MLRKHRTLLACVGLLVLLPDFATAQSIVGSADAGRFKPETSVSGVKRSSREVFVPELKNSGVSTPKGAENIQFVLKNLQIDGVTVFNEKQLQALYGDYLGKQVGLDKVYIIADKITKHYKDNGYFLSLAYIPNQKITNGVVNIKIVEGFVGEVVVDGKQADSAMLQKYIDKLIKHKPLTSAQMESFLLRVNDLPGLSFQGVLSSFRGEEAGAVRLNLVKTSKSGSGKLSFDNFSSRFLGPHEVMLSYSKSLLDLQQTSLSVLTSTPADEINYFALGHSVAIAPNLIIDVSGSVTKAKPGFYLKPLDVKSNSEFLSVSLLYQLLRQRQENLSLKLTLDGRNSNTELLSTTSSQDHIRALRANASWNGADSWLGSNALDITLSQGIAGLGASDVRDANLSRAQAKPDFTKLELSVIRLQSIVDNWSVQLGVQAQIASGSLFSSEEFGFGGQTIGRAFDSSEITGDNGLSGSIELRYSRYSGENSGFEPYVFYDVGGVWNKNTGQAYSEKASSIGFGVRALSDVGLSANLGLAWPLMRDISSPLYGESPRDPRILLQIVRNF